MNFSFVLSRPPLYLHPTILTCEKQPSTVFSTVGHTHIGALASHSAIEHLPGDTFIPAARLHYYFVES